jgi:ketosteroid isomerase-like protein
VSRENVEIVRRVMDAEGRRDLEAIFTLYDEDIEWDVSRAAGPVAGYFETFRVHERHGKVVRVAWFQERAEALEAAGLRG